MRKLWWIGATCALVLAGCSCDDPADLPDGSMPDGGPSIDAPMGMAVCGDGDVEGDEVCDDGNTEDGDGCSADCSSDETCGNAVTDDAAGEVCDDGNTSSGDGCSADCVSDETCGNDVVDLAVGEACDDGNTDGADGCSADCTSDETCGNSIVDEDAGEQCDDGNTTPDDGCDGSCQLENCGDGVVDPLEQCDDMNDVDGDGCDTDCSFSCEADADCMDPGMCMIAACDTSTHVCQSPTDAADGDDCDRDSDPGTRDICLSGSCMASTCGDGFIDTTEDCDDGNDVDGDGCDNDCTLSCTMDSDCDDSALCNGSETCDTSTNACVSGTNATDGTDCGGGMVCRSGACTSAMCGNGSVEGTEDCDDGNTTSGDGCDNDCTFSCAMDSDCADSSVCNGMETCDTSSHTCSAGSPASDGTACDRDSDPGTRDICRTGSCSASTCGDSFTDPGRTPAEDCDDGNSTDGDGCDNDCTFSCTMDSDCDDLEPCTGVETCNTTTNVCTNPADLADGNLCDADMTASTRDICVSSLCQLTTCGDGVLDSGATPAEECDDGNTTDGDGCEADCTLPAVMPTAYRITSLAIRDPHLYARVIICADITGTANTELNNAMDDSSGGGPMMDMPDGVYDLSFASVHMPLDLSMATNPVDVHFDAECSIASPRDSCSPAAMAMPVSTMANNMSSGTCFTADSTTLNSAYTAPNSPMGPCFATDSETITVNLGGIVITLYDAQVAATYGSGAPPGTLTNGVISGFLTEDDARATVLPASLPLIGGDTLYEHLADGGASGSSCSSRDDSDTHAVTGMGTVNGFWFYIDFTAELVDWTP